MELPEIKFNKCGAVNDYYTEVKTNNNVCYCGKCNSYIKNIAYAEPMLYVGKYKNIPISKIDDMDYLRWAKNTLKLSANVRDAIEKRISEFEHLAR